MSDGSGEIIVKGGSCELHFEEGLFEKDPNDPKRHKHKKNHVNIRRIVITGNRNFDSGDIPGGFKGDVNITFKP